MNYHPEIHHRRSIRLKGYDYSQSGFYFITLCCQNRENLFGEIIVDEMVMNDAGRMVGKWFYELENKFTDIKCDEMVVMPNHVHFIVVNIAVKPVASVGANLCVRPSIAGDHVGDHGGEHEGEHAGSPLPTRRVCTGEQTGEHIGSPLRVVVQWFKTMTTNEYIRGVKYNGWRRFNGKLWQRNYWEHIIRDEKSLEHIRDYIINNPAKWTDDENNISQSERHAR